MNSLYSLLSGTTGGSNTGSKGYTQAWLRGGAIKHLLTLVSTKNHLHTCILRLRSWRLCCPCARGSRACRCFWFCRRKFSISSLHFYYLVLSHRLARPRMRTTMVRSWSPGWTLRATRWSWFKLNHLFIFNQVWSKTFGTQLSAAHSVVEVGSNVIVGGGLYKVGELVLNMFLSP